MTVINYIYVINKRKYVFFLIFKAWTGASMVGMVDQVLSACTFPLFCLITCRWHVPSFRAILSLSRYNFINYHIAGNGHQSIIFKKSRDESLMFFRRLAWFSSWHVRLVISDIIPRVVSEMSSALIGIMLNLCKVNRQ